MLHSWRTWFYNNTRVRPTQCIYICITWMATKKKQCNTMLMLTTCSPYKCAVVLWCNRRHWTFVALQLSLSWSIYISCIFVHMLCWGVAYYMCQWFAFISLFTPRLMQERLWRLLYSTTLFGRSGARFIGRQSEIDIIWGQRHKHYYHIPNARANACSWVQQEGGNESTIYAMLISQNVELCRLETIETYCPAAICFLSCY